MSELLHATASRSRPYRERHRRGSREVSAESIVAFYDKELHLDDAQKAALRELAQPFRTELTRTQSQSKERVAVFRTYFPKVRALLEGDQLPKFDELTKRHRARMDRTPE